jgi:hypothetical protein
VCLKRTNKIKEQNNEKDCTMKSFVVTALQQLLLTVLSEEECHGLDYETCSMHRDDKYTHIFLEKTQDVSANWGGG